MESQPDHLSIRRKSELRKQMPTLEVVSCQKVLHLKIKISTNVWPWFIACEKARHKETRERFGFSTNGNSNPLWKIPAIVFGPPRWWSDVGPNARNPRNCAIWSSHPPPLSHLTKWGEHTKEDKWLRRLSTWVRKNNKWLGDLSSFGSVEEGQTNKQNMRGACMHAYVIPYQLLGKWSGSSQVP